MKINLSIYRPSLAIGMICFVSLTVFAQSDTITPPTSMEIQGIPPIPTSLVKSIAPYTSAYGPALAGWDPVKREIWTKGLSTTAWIARVESPGGPQKLWKHMNVGQVYDLYFNPQAKYLIYNKDTNGNEAYQMYLYNVQTDESTLLSDGSSRNTEFVWSKSGDRIIYCRSLASEGPGVSLYYMNPFDPKSNQLLVKSDGNYLKAYDWSPDEQKVVFCEFISLHAVKLWIMDIPKGEKMLLSISKEQIDEYYSNPQFSKDGKGIYVITDNNSDLRQLAYLDLSTKKYKYVTKDIKWEIDDFSLSPDGKIIALTANEEGVSRLYFLETATWQLRQVAEVPLGIISGVRWHNNSTDLAFDFKSLRTPNDVYSVDAKTGKVERWSQSRSRNLDTEQLMLPEVIRWKSFDGQRIPGFIYRPPSKYSGKRPVIIYLHGGPSDRYKPGFGYHYNYYLNEMGIALIMPNFRGSTGYGKKFLNSDNGLQREDAIKDIGALLNWIKLQPDLNSEKVMLWGASYGGFLALSSAYQFGDRICCIVSQYGIANLATFVERMEASRRALQRAEFGDERDPKIRAFMEQISPLTHGSKIKKPLLVIHGKNDPRVSVNEAISIIEAVKKNGVPVWYLLANDEGHNFRKRHNWDFSSYVIVRFAQEYLLAK